MTSIWIENPSKTLKCEHCNRYIARKWFYAGSSPVVALCMNCAKHGWWYGRKQLTTELELTPNQQEEKKHIIVQALVEELRLEKMMYEQRISDIAKDFPVEKAFKMNYLRRY